MPPSNSGIMRNHPFVGDGPYCQHWSGSTYTTAAGVVEFGSQCGWSRETHPPDLDRSNGKPYSPEVDHAGS